MSGYFASVNDVYGRDFTKNMKCNGVVCDPAVVLLNSPDDYSFPYERYNRTYEALSVDPNTKKSIQNLKDCKAIQQKQVIIAEEKDAPKPFSLSELRKRVVTNDVPQEYGECVTETERVGVSEVFLYILSGVMVILMLEQVLQLGIHMRIQ